MSAPNASRIVPKHALLELLECPICLLRMSAPIYQCVDGHVLCGDCRERIVQPRRCPQCRRSLGHQRARFAERALGVFEFPCNNSAFGCPEFVRVSMRTSHLAACDYAPLACPHDPDNCQWQGSLSQVVGHVRVDHDAREVIYPVATERTWALRVSDLVALRACRVVNSIGYTFLLNAKFEAGRLFASIRQIGRDEFGGTYRIRFKLKDGHKLMRRGPVESIGSRESDDSLLWFSEQLENIRVNHLEADNRFIIGFTIFA
eukprot:218248_1